MSIKYKIILIIIGLASAFGAGRYLSPTKIETQTKVERETKYITRVIKQPDGTITEERIEETTTTVDRDKKQENKKADYKIGIVGIYDVDKKETSYAITAERRLLLNIFGGAFIEPQNKRGGISLSMEF